jgi:hypothetical protein
MQLGRELRVDELSAILKQHGHPMVVASRYRDQPWRGLIGPGLFPIYWFALRAIFGVWLTVRVIVAVFAFQGTAAAGSILLNLSRDIMLVGFFIAAGVTAVFAAWEYLESLAPVPPPMPQPPQPRPAVQIIGGIAGLFFLAMALFWPAMFWVWGLKGTFSPSATVLAVRLPWLLLVSLWISQTWLNYTRFAKADWRPALRTFVNMAGLVLVIHLLIHRDLLVAGPNMNPAQGATLAALNRFFAGILAIACISSGWVCVREWRRYIRNAGRRVGGDRQPADSAS